MHAELASQTRPPIILVDTEADSLFDLAMAAHGTSQMGAELLLQELGRADTCKLAEIPDDVVTMLSHVVFVDEGSGEQHHVQLVYPKAADAALHRISVLTPVGAALIGMRKGASIDWPNRAGASRPLKILSVAQPRHGA
jgi:regulator of nucleoside diphosphate kinase